MVAFGIVRGSAHLHLTGAFVPLRPAFINTLQVRYSPFNSTTEQIATVAAKQLKTKIYYRGISQLAMPRHTTSSYSGLEREFRSSQVAVVATAHTSCDYFCRSVASAAAGTTKTPRKAGRS